MQITTVSDIITKKVLNENTGELELQDYTQIKKTKRMRGGYRMVYKSYDDAIIEVVKSQKDLKIIIAIRDKFTYKQVEHNLSAIELAEEFSVSRQKITSILKDLVNVKLLKKITRSLYRLNPFMYVPYKADAETLQREWNELPEYIPKRKTKVVKEDPFIKAWKKANSKGTSYLKLQGGNMTKQEITNELKKGEPLEFVEVEFEELVDLLSNNAIYSNYQFKHGKRGKDNIVGGTSFIVLDIDDSNITDTEAHFLLSDLNHIIARTSDPDNVFKFRILLELDSVLNIDAIQYPYFIESVANELGLVSDRLPQSQIYYSYADREILSVLDGDKLDIKPHLVNSAEQVNSKPVKPKKLTNAQQKDALENKMTTFEYAFNCPENGGGSRALYKAGKHAIDLGASPSYVESLLREINSFWSNPMEESRLEETLIRPLIRGM